MLKNIFRDVIKAARGYLCDQRGFASVMFAVAIPMLMASTGVAMDLSTAYNAKMRLGQALDKATLAASSSTGTDSQLQQVMQNFFYANYPTTGFGTPHDITLTISGSVMTATAHTKVPTTFMSLFGINYLDVGGESQVVRALSGIEAVLVLDTTGSMAGNNIAALKTASTNFLNIMFNEITDIKYIKIGIVPWSDAVNVGPYGLGKDMQGNTYGTAFVDKLQNDPYGVAPANLNYGTGDTDWGGCVLEKDPPQFTDAAPPPNWQMYRYPSGSCSQYNCTQYSCAQYNCAQYACQTYNCTQYNCAQYYCTKCSSGGISNGVCTTHGATCKTFSNSQCLTFGTTCLVHGTTCQTYSTTQCQTQGTTCLQQGTTCKKFGTTCVQWANSPNDNCPTVPIQPLTNSKSKLQNVINSLPTQGNTYSDIGMLWGWRVLSPGAPFTEAAPYDDLSWSKTVILMTDGNNTINNVLSGEGPAGASGISTTTTQQNNNFETVCTRMKAMGIRIYTITFQSAINTTTKSFYRNCATTSSMYYDAPTNQGLTDAFTSIANQLSQLHITQ